MLLNVHSYSTSVKVESTGKDPFSIDKSDVYSLSDKKTQWDCHKHGER